MKRFFPYDVFARLASLTNKRADKESKIQPTAVPLDALPEHCNMTMHHEISARSSLMPAGDGSTLLFDCSRQDSEGEKSRPLDHTVFSHVCI